MPWTIRRLASSAAVVVVALLLPAAAAAKKPAPPPPPPPTPGPATSTYVRNYANVVNGVQYGLTSEDVHATSDGGSIDLAITASPDGSHPGVSWLMKADAVGTPQWQEEVGCFDTPPGVYADDPSLAQTSDGGYVLAGGTIGCGSGTECSALSGIQCALVERLDATGRLEWASVYSAGVDGTVFDAVAPTSDGGVVAVGSATDANHDIGALAVKLSGAGDVEWARELAPTGTAQAEFATVTATTDGGFVAAGDFFVPSATTPRHVLVAKFDGGGQLTWQRGLAGASSERAFSAVQTTDGGLALAGSWNSTTSPGTCCSGPLVVQLDASGAAQWQKAYSGGVYCFDNGFSETCTSIGGFAYSLHQTGDGGYLLAGASQLELYDETPLVPWLAKTDANGSLVWQESDYRVNPASGRPLSEDFAAAAVTPAGYLAAGWTENVANGLGELLGVQTDPNGAVGTCSAIHATSTLAPTDPSLGAVAPGLAVTTPVVARASSPATTEPTSIAAGTGQC